MSWLDRCRASPAPYEPVPSTPIRCTCPCPPSQRSSARYPAAPAGNVAWPKSYPTEFSAATVWVSAWVSTPPMIRGGLSTMGLRLLSWILFLGQARTAGGRTAQ